MTHDAISRGAPALEKRLLATRMRGLPAFLPYLVAGRPRRDGFGQLLRTVAQHADVIEIGLPFSDPVADGPVIAGAARRALADGVDLAWLLGTVQAERSQLDAGLVLMSYLNPLLAGGLERNLDAVARAGFDGLIVPDVPLEESAELRASCDTAGEHGLALIQLVTPLTSPARARAIARASRGFLYAVTRTGTTGARADAHAIRAYLEELRALSPLPVCAGFGIRDGAQAHSLSGHADGLIVGTALVEKLERGEPIDPFLASFSR